MTPCVSTLLCILHTHRYSTCYKQRRLTFPRHVDFAQPHAITKHGVSIAIIMRKPNWFDPYYKAVSKVCWTYLSRCRVTGMKA
eukprot:3269580-Pleurochrysis_carterae.AAC.1